MKETFPILSEATARWDADAGRVRYYAANYAEGEWIEVEVSSDEFANVARASIQDSLGLICANVDETLARVNAAMEEFAGFRKAMETMMPRRVTPEDKEN